MSSRLRDAADWLIYLAVRIIVCVLQTLRIETCQSLARVLAYVANDVLRIRASILDENVRHAFPRWSESERKAFARRTWEQLVLLVCEVAHAPRKIHDTNWRQYVQLSGKEEVVRTLLRPRPTIMLSGHFGNFEVAGFMLGLLGFPCFAVARPLDNRYLNRFLNEFRQSKGQFILPKQGSAAAIEALLETGRVLSLLGDQYAGPKGCWVNFLGRPASCHKALALFSLTSGAPLVVCYAKRLQRPLHFEIGQAGVADPRQLPPEQAAVRPLTEWYNRMLEDVIRSAPEQYWWIHRRWKGALPQSNRGRREKAA